MISEEPTVTLASGVTVDEGVYSVYADLLANGHRIELTDEGDVFVIPVPHPDCLHVLAANSHQVAKLLQHDGDTRVM